ncbi:MAG: lipid-A-disaccharide synthase [candidate division WOR-3 bacterium]
MKILFVAGEISGDKNASYLIEKILEKRKDIEIFAYGGKEMEKKGAVLIKDITEKAVVGFTEAIGIVGFFKNLLKEIIYFVIKNDIKKIVLVDFPGFNLILAKHLKKIKREVFYYIPPQVWAWGSWRIRDLRRYTDRVLSTFPFEADFLRKKGVPAFFVGTPIAERINWNLNKEKWIIFLPGSRKKEIKRHIIDMIKIRDYIEEDFKDYKFLISIIYPEKEILEKIKNKFEVIDKDPTPYIEKSKFAITVSGTASLECALAGTPMVVIYKVSELTYYLARILTKVPYVSLVNIISGKKIIPEYIQHIKLKDIRDFLVSLSQDEKKLERILCELETIRKILSNNEKFNPVYLILNSINGK